MRDLFHEGLNLGESLARLPWKAARRIAGQSETLRQAADLGERLGTLPFRAARAVVGEKAPASRAATGAGGPPEETPRTRVAVLGAGYAGLTCFLELQDHAPSGVNLVLVNGDKYHWFTTELHTYVAGEAADHVRVPLSRVVSRPGRLLVGRVDRIDLDDKAVELAGGERLPYDYMVFALGSDPEYYGLPGVAEYSLIVGNWQSAGKLRERVAALTAARQGGDAPPRVVVAGGGLTGVEVAGELVDEHGERLAVTIVEAGPEIMAGFAPELVATARSVLVGKGIAIRTGVPIVAVEPDRLRFRDGSEEPFDVLVWAGGVRGSAVLARSGFDVTPKGRARVDGYLRALGNPDTYIVGDSAAFTDPATGRELGPTAQAAVQMGRAAARNILHRLRGQVELPFEPHLKGVFASLGRQEGVGQIGAEQYVGGPAMVIKQLIEAHHAWETGAGVMPLVGRLLQAPGRWLRGRPAAGAAPRPH